MLWAMGFIVVFVMGGVTGVNIANPAFDILAQDTYYVVAHFHYVMSLGAAFGLFAALYYWIGKMSGRQYPEWAGRTHLWTTFISANITFFPMHMLGAAGMPRRYIDYALPFAGWNFLISIGAFLGAASFLFGMGVIAYTIAAGRRVRQANYWGPGALRSNGRSLRLRLIILLTSCPALSLHPSRRPMARRRMFTLTCRGGI